MSNDNWDYKEQDISEAEETPTSTLAGSSEMYELKNHIHHNLMEQVNSNLRQRFNVDPTRLVVRCFPVNREDQSGGQQEVICVAVGKDVVLRHINIARNAKLDIVGMHCEQLASLQAFSHLYRRKDSSELTTCFVDIGAGTTKVMISHGASMVFAKTIYAGGDHLTKHVSESEEISFSEAREKRIAEVQASIPDRRGKGKPVAAGEVSVEARRDELAMTSIDSSGGSESAMSKKAEAKASVVGVIGGNDGGDTLDCLIDELQMCVRYHRSRFADRKIDKLVFLGGESKRASTCQTIAKALRIGAQLGDPMARMTRSSKARPPYGVDLRQPQPGWAVPMGLCLSEANL